jgi:DNA-binding protein HU-beta
MNKGELIDAITIKAHVTKKEADAVLSATLETIVEAIALFIKINQGFQVT